MQTQYKSPGDKSTYNSYIIPNIHYFVVEIKVEELCGIIECIFNHYYSSTGILIGNNIYENSCHVLGIIILYEKWLLLNGFG